MTKQEAEKIEQSVAEEERLLYEQSDQHVEVVELTRLAAIKVCSVVAALVPVTHQATVTSVLFMEA